MGGRSSTLTMRLTAKRGRGMMIVALALGLAILAGSWFVMERRTDQSEQQPVPAAISREVSFPVYYPATLPAGFAVEPGSFDHSHGIVTYTVRYGANKKLAFTIQAVPAGFDPDSLHATANQLASSLGPAYVGAISGNTAVSIVTSEAWMMIGIPSDIETSKLATVLSDLRPARKN